MADVAARADASSAVSRRVPSKLQTIMQRKSTVAFLMTLPLIILVAVLVIYPAFYALHLATLNKRMTQFVGLNNFTFLFTRETFWMVVQQSCIFALTAVFFKAIIGFIVARSAPVGAIGVESAVGKRVHGDLMGSVPGPDR